MWLQAEPPIEAIDLTEDVTEGGDEPGSVLFLFFFSFKLFSIYISGCKQHHNHQKGHILQGPCTHAPIQARAAAPFLCSCSPPTPTRLLPTTIKSHTFTLPHTFKHTGAGQPHTLPLPHTKERTAHHQKDPSQGLRQQPYPHPLTPLPHPHDPSQRGRQFTSNFITLTHPHIFNHP